MIVVVDYGLGNLRSILKICKNVSDEIIISSSPEMIKKCKKIILPGVGHFKTAIENLSNLNLINVLNENVLIKKKPVLGICLGMQIMTDSSEESAETNGLGWIRGKTIKMNVKGRVPHIGWNSVEILKENKLLSITDIESVKNEFFFVHSFHVKIKDKSNGIFKTKYLNENFISGFSKENIYGVQFHPEKSYDIGEKLISNFIKNV